MKHVALIAATFVVLMSGGDWGRWHFAHWPGGIDLVRVAHAPTGTYCVSCSTTGWIPGWLAYKPRQQRVCLQRISN